MGAINKDFDEIMSEHTKALTTGRKMQLDILIKEIAEYNYTTFNELHGALLSHLELIEGKGNEPMTSEQYEAEANADHLTSEQFPNV